MKTADIARNAGHLYGDMMPKKNHKLDYLRKYSREELIEELKFLLVTDYNFHSLKHYDLMMLKCLLDRLISRQEKEK